MQNAGHVNLYDRVNLIPFNKLGTFFKKNLGASGTLHFDLQPTTIPQVQRHNALRLAKEFRMDGHTLTVARTFEGEVELDFKPHKRETQGDQVLR